jgi:phage terminase small subunit
MPNKSLTSHLADDYDNFGPYMQAISPKHRAFVLAYCTNGCDGTNAARDAGYADTGGHANAGIRVLAHRLLKNPRILAAIREVTIAMTQANLPVYQQTLEKVAANPQSKDQVKALLALMDRGGMNVVSQSEHNINITVNKSQQVEEIKQMAEQLGLDPKLLLGTVTDAEYEDIPDGLEDVW